ncbi:enolase C-terminal domain-like protein [Chloroflexota bacterium]
MKITNVRLRKLDGSMTQLPFSREERFRRPTDIYPEFKALRNERTIPTPNASGLYPISRIFVQIDTDEGVSGIGGPVGSLGPNAPSFYIEAALKPLLIGRDPIASEMLWDLMYRSNTAGRAGDYMRAISYVDIALWDLKGKWLGQPVCQLFGGPVQDKIPAYISTLGYSLNTEKAVEKTRDLISQGYTAMKWFFTEGPTDGPEGERKNVELMRALRETAGPDMKIMIDAWKSWDIPYTLKMVDLLADYDPYWIEEPLMPDRIKDLAHLTATCPVLITTGEQAYTRWSFQLMMDAKAADIYQPEPVSSGGISEVMKICTMASARDLPAILHCGSLQANLNICFTQNAVVAPMMEYLLVSQEGGNQHFFKNLVKPVDGYFYPPTVPGVIQLDESKIESSHDVSWRLTEV